MGPIFTPREREAAKKIRMRYWRKRNPEPAEVLHARYLKRIQNPAFIRRMRETGRLWLKAHPHKASEYSRRRVQRMPDGYVAVLLRGQGVKVTPEAIKRKREAVQNKRSRKAMRMLYAITRVG